MPHNAVQGRPGLQRLIFVSRSTAASPDELDRDLKAIETASAIRNRKAGITGYFVAHQGWYLQSLEGPTDEVKATFGRIAADARHRQPKIVVSRPAEQRCFADWPMTGRRLTVADETTLARLNQARDFDPTRLTARNALALLMTASQAAKPKKSVLWID
jgi:hypothetical protein